MAEKMKTIEEGISAHGPLTEDELLYVATKLATYLAALHQQGKVHLKLTPPNLFVDDDGNLQMEEGAGDFHSSAVHRLTLGFNAPEVLLGEEATAKTDIYKTGLLLQYLGTKEWPYKTLKRADDLSRIYSEAPFEKEPPFSDHFLDLVKKCQSRDPDERLADGNALSKELAGLVAMRFGDGEPPNLRKWLSGRPFPRVKRKKKDAAKTSKKELKKEPSFSTLPVLVPILLSIFLVAFVLTRPKEQVHVEDIRLRFAGSGIRVTGRYPVGTELQWRLSQARKSLRQGKLELGPSGQFVIAVDELSSGEVYVLSLERDKVLLGQMGFSLPKGRSR